MITVYIVCIWIAFAVLSAIVASNKNRSVLGWALIGLLFSVFGFLAALVVSEVEKEGDTSRGRKRQCSTTQVFDPDEHEKKCPMCAEYIKLEARICRYCGHEFSEEDVKRQIEETKMKVKKKSDSLDSLDAILATHDFSNGSTCQKCGVTKSYAMNSKYECPS